MMSSLVMLVRIKKVKSIEKKISSSGLTCFLSATTLKPSDDFIAKLQDALTGSQQFVVYYSEQAGESAWVEREINIFLSQCHIHDKENRQMYVLLDKKCSEHSVPPFLGVLQRPESPEALVTELNRHVISNFKARLKRAKEQEEQLVADINNQNQNEIKKLADKLEHERQKVEEARYYYRHDRFWSQIAENRHLLFTCGRDVRSDPDSLRGYGGRTNIDLWDYRAVLDITHFF